MGNGLSRTQADASLCATRRRYGAASVPEHDSGCALSTRRDESVHQFRSFHFSTQDVNRVANFGEKIHFLYKELLFQLLHHVSNESIMSEEKFFGTEESAWGPCGENCRSCWV